MKPRTIRDPVLEAIIVGLADAEGLSVDEMADAVEQVGVLAFELDSKLAEVVIAFLEEEFGRMERLPGQMLRGLNQQYTWRGSESELNLTYQAGTERGYLFLDSRSLAPRFNDLLADTAE